MSKQNTSQKSEHNEGQIDVVVMWMKIKAGRLRTKTWGVRIFIMNLSWLPLWWLKKHIPKDEISWTPAATIRGLVKRVEFEKRHYDSLMKSFTITEKEFALYRKAHFSKITNDHQKKILKDSFGIDLST